MLTDQYRPKKISEFVGQKKAVTAFLTWIKKKKSKAALFHGPPGVGKTALVGAFARENNYDLIEMNASDFRSAKDLQQVIGQSLSQKSLFKKNKIFLLDELDGLNANDRGAVSEIIKIIEVSHYPLVLTANDPWEPKLRSLRKYCQLIEFKRLTVLDIERKLQMICRGEGYELAKEDLHTLASLANGDLRAAINDLETIVSGQGGKIEDLGQREKVIGIFETLRTLFKATDFLKAKQVVDSTDKSIDEIFWWIENNIANEYEEPEEIAEAFDRLSQADLIRQRIIKRQNWKLLPYAIDLMTAGVALAKKSVYRKFTLYRYPENIIILGANKGKRQSKKEKLAVLSAELHCSTKSLERDFLPYLRIINSGLPVEV